MGENIGTTARAMLNCGLTDLRLVRPRDGWPNLKAERAAVGAFEMMPTGQAVRDAPKRRWPISPMSTRPRRATATW